MDIDSSASSLHARAAVRRQGSAAEKVWRTAELATQILSYLVRERIDLIVCSTVSKYFRALSLPLLVHALDVHLPNAPRTCYFFETNPKMGKFIKYIRIWDDKQDCRDPNTETNGSVHVYDSDEERDPKWMEIAHLFDLILKSRTKEQLPLVDITIGAASISALSAMLQRHEQATRRIVALRIVPSSALHHLRVYHDNSEQTLKVAELMTMRWRQLGLLLTDMCKTSANANSPMLKRFHFGGNDFYDWSAHAEFWHCLKRALPATIEDLVLWLPLPESDFLQAAVLLEAEWPHLRAFNLDVEPRDGKWESRIDQFLARHQHLENIEVTNAKVAPEVTIPKTFPKLKTCHLNMMMDADLASFLSRHFHTIRDLKVPHSSLHRSPSTILPHAILDKQALGTDALQLDVLHASPSIAAHLVHSGVTVRHYEFGCLSSIKELRMDDWLFPVREAAEAVTCLDIQVWIYYADGMDIGRDQTLRGNFLPVGALPNLTELALSWGGYNFRVNLSTADGEALIAGALATLKHQKFLRHLRLEHSGGQPFPPGPNAVLEVENSNQIPPRLEYFTWHLSYHAYTQRYRVMLPAQPDLATDSTGGMETRHPPLKLRLQRLPQTFADRIDERGVWDRPQRRRNGNTIFDHSKSPPELYV
ncbi:hypothetical protein CF326_g1734 [Tilletia indica]|nr:hypothetical protein CF326_g1734 [Tilletia indica]